ncbi:MAG: hypothetical protein ABL925_09100 [Methylococcales bacterium]
MSTHQLQAEWNFSCIADQFSKDQLANTPSLSQSIPKRVARIKNTSIDIELLFQRRLEKQLQSE